MHTSSPNTSNVSHSIQWDEDLIRRHDLAGPRYTSYPTAPQFRQDYGQAQWLQAVEQSNQSARPLSLYFHIPFCDTVCYYCGCNKIITADKKRAEPYLKALFKEIAMQSQYIKPNRPVQQLHFGGGTPTYLSDTQLSELMEQIAQHFQLEEDQDAEYSIEIHPNTVNPQRLAHLRQLGFNRLSLGVQDFNPQVQKAVNRFNSEAEVRALVEASRALNFSSISMDLIYGLPHQSIESFSLTVDKIIALRPDRLSLFNYAHMPHLFKVQKQIDARQLPEPQEKLQILHQSIDQLLAAGYVYIGMDHFALPEDELAKAQAKGQLHRNFQGYATHGNCDLFSFGVSSISAINQNFAQNEKDLASYLEAIDSGRLPLAKGIEVNKDDLIRRDVIYQLICHFNLNCEELESKWNIDFSQYFEKELTDLEPLIEDGLLSINKGKILVEDRGRLLIRRICMVFDAYIHPLAKQEPGAPKYSRII